MEQGPSCKEISGSGCEGTSTSKRKAHKIDGGIVQMLDFDCAGAENLKLLSARPGHLPLRITIVLASFIHNALFPAVSCSAPVVPLIPHRQHTNKAPSCPKSPQISTPELDQETRKRIRPPPSQSLYSLP